MHKVKIQLITQTDVVEFVTIASQLNGEVKLIDGRNYCINAKSLLGSLAAMEWEELYCVSDEDIYSKIAKFAI